MGVDLHRCVDAQPPLETGEIVVNDVYTAITHCENATLLALLLTSHFELNSNPSVTTRSDIEDRLQVELIHSLQQLRDFLRYSHRNKKKVKFTREQLEMVNKAWAQTQRAVNEYIYPKTENAISCLENYFGKYDQKAIGDIVTGIKKYLASLNGQ